MSEQTEQGDIMITGAQVHLFHVMQMRAALGLEIRTGMAFSSKGSLVKHAIRCGYVAEGTRAKRDAYQQLDALIVANGGQARPLDA